MPEVLVVGAGPVGLTMAAELARYGVSLRLIDRAAEPTKTSKALAVWSRTLELLDRSGCTREFLDIGLRCRGVSVRHGGEQIAHNGLDTIESPYNYGLMIPQSETERLLAAHLASLGVSVEREVTLRHFDDRADHVVARLAHTGGDEEEVSCRWLVGCDGAHSAVRHGLALPFDGETEGDDWMLADVKLDGVGAPARDEVTANLHRDGPLVVFPMPGGRARVVAVLGKTVPGQTRNDPTLAEVQALVDARAGAGIAVTDPAWLSNFHVNERKVAEYRRGQVFVAGDAAHVHSPVGGQGMNTGMQDAVNLAWKLAMVVRGDAAVGLLDSYTPERSAVGTMVLRNVTRMTDMATLSNPAAQAVRNFAVRVLFGFAAVRERVASAVSEIEISYADSPLSVGRHAGDRLPPSQYGGAPPGSGAVPRFVLYAADVAAGTSLTLRFPTLIEAAVRAPVDPGRLLIVRPDGYVGLSAGERDWNAAEGYLAKLVA